MTANKPGLLKSTGLYSFGMIFLRASNFLLLPFYSQVFSTSDFGNYTLILSFYTILAVVVQAGFQASLTKYYVEAESSDEKKKIFSTTLSTLGIISVMFAFGLILFARQTSLLLVTTGDYSSIIIAVAVLLVIETVAFYNLHLLRAREESKKYVLVVSVSAIINLLFNFIFISSFKFGILGIFLAQIVSSSISLLLSYRFIKNDFSFQIDYRLLKKLFVFSLPLLAAGILSTFVDVADRFLINHYMSAKEVGSYSFAYRIAMVMNIVVISFGSAWNPRSLDDYKKKIFSATLPVVFTKLFFLLTFVLLAVSLLIDNLFTFQFYGKTFFAKEYYSGIFIIPFILLSYFFRGLSSFYSVYPLTTGKSYHYLIGDLAGFITNILLNVLLIPKYGLLGAAVATLVSYFLIAFYAFMISYKALDFVYEKWQISFMLVTTTTFYLVSSYLNNLALDIILVVGYLLIGYRMFLCRKEGVNIFKVIK